MSVTEQDRQRAAEIVAAHTSPYYDTGAIDCDDEAMKDAIAEALAAERERALAPFRRLAESFAAQDYQEWHGDELAELLRDALDGTR